MPIVFNDPKTQSKFEQCTKEIDEYREVLAQEVDMTDHQSVLKAMQSVTDVLHIGARLEAQMQYFNDLNKKAKALSLRNEQLTPTEKRMLLDSEIGDTQFYQTFIQLLRKDMHKKAEMLRSALSFMKAEMQTV